MRIAKYLSILFILSYASLQSQWMPISNGIENKTVYSLTCYNNNIFAGTLNSGLYISTNNGLNWTMAGNALYSRIVFSLTDFGGYLYAGTDLGVWKTSNNGNYWIVTSINNNSIYSLASNQSRVFAGLHNAGVFYSTGGTGWMLSPLNATNIKALAINGNFIAAGCGNNAGVYISSNNGANWISTPLNNKSVYALALSGNNIFAGTGSGVFYSTDLGNSWLHSSLNNNLVYSIAVNGNTVFAGTELSGIFVSYDNGINWVQKNEGLGNARVNALCIYNNYIYAGVSGNGVYKRSIGELVGLKQISGENPSKFVLNQNFPNPFNPSTNINFSIHESGIVSLVIYDVTGKVVRKAINENLSTGNYTYTFNALGLSSGIYLYTLKSGKFSETKKMILVK